MAYRSSNPVFTNRNYAPSPDALQEMYAQPQRLTVDDVVVHTGGLLALLVVGGLFGWFTTSEGSLGLGSAAAIVALGLSWFVAPMLARTGRFGASFAVPFALIEGVFVGAVSRAYDYRWHGIVAQALIGTACVFGTMLLLHTSGKVRATPRMYRVVGAGMIAVVLVGVIDLILGAFTSYQVPFVNNGNGPISILVTLGILALASFMFTLDFDMVQRSVASGAPQKQAWLLSYGLMISFVWVYLELLRLISQLRR